MKKERVGEKMYVLKRELDNLHNLKHPNILLTYEIYEDDKYLHVVCEECKGGSLLDLIMKDTFISE